MRGKAAAVPLPFPPCRITPAYAGKSYKYSAVYDLEEDHPRLCGEKTKTFISFTTFQGSPPPMRGKGQTIKHFVNVGRITPAYAGKRDSVKL